MSYWFVAVVMASGMVLGSIFTTIYYYYKTQKFIDRVREQLGQPDQVNESDTYPIWCEYADRMFLAYETDTVSFLAQGKTLQDLLTALDQRLSRSGNYHIHTDADTAEKLREESTADEAR